MSCRPCDTPWGRVGIMICADARLPEIAATLATRRRQLLLQPTAWVNVGTPDEPVEPAAGLPDPRAAVGVRRAGCVRHVSQIDFKAIADAYSASARVRATRIFAAAVNASN